MGSGWFDTTEPPLSTYLEEKQGVQGDHHIIVDTPTLLTKKPPSVLTHRNAVCSVFTAYTELKLCYIHTHTHNTYIIYI